MRESFWAGRRVLVTGHTGFKGAWLSLWLEALGAEVAGLSLRRPSEPALFDLARVGEGVRSFEGDVRDSQVVAGTLDEFRPEAVFHLAAQPIVRRSFRDPVDTYATNVMGTVHVLEAARLTPGVRVVVNVTSDKCYANREWTWGYREYEPMGGHDPYSSSKGCAELVTAAYRESFFADPEGPRVASARAGNVVGGGDWGEDRLIPDLMRAALAGEPAVIRNPGSIRPWQHVLNPLSGYLVLAEWLWSDPQAAEGWNFGPDEGDAWPVSRIVARLAELWGGKLEWTSEGSDQAVHEATYLKLDSSKARSALGWKASWDLDAGLRAIVDWYQAYGADADMRATTLGQIESFVLKPAGASR